MAPKIVKSVKSEDAVKKAKKAAVKKAVAPEQLLELTNAINTLNQLVPKVKKVAVKKVKAPGELKELTDALNTLNHSTSCDLFLKVSPLILICHDIEGSYMYYYEEATQLYTPIGIKALAMKVGDTLSVYLSKASKQLDQTMWKDFGKLQKSLGNQDFRKNVASILCSKSFEEGFAAKLDTHRSTMNFKNGILCLETGKFRPRTKDDFVSKCLDYDYTTDVNKKVHKTLLGMIMNIFNDDKVLYETNMAWFGYSMTGETARQKFLATIGHTAQNGKSTVFKMFDNAFPIYCAKIDKATFSKDNPKRHKQIALSNILKTVDFPF